MPGKNKRKEIKYLCPNCFLLQDKVEVYVNACEVLFYENGFYKGYDPLDSYVVKIIFSDCGCTTHSYNEEELEVEIDNEKKTVKLLSDFQIYELEIRERNPEYKDYQFIYW